LVAQSRCITDWKNKCVPGQQPYEITPLSWLVPAALDPQAEAAIALDALTLHDLLLNDHPLNLLTLHVHPLRNNHALDDLLLVAIAVAQPLRASSGSAA
jgi:hypothetical protein